MCRIHSKLYKLHLFRVCDAPSDRLEVATTLNSSNAKYEPQFFASLSQPFRDHVEPAITDYKISLLSLIISVGSITVDEKFAPELVEY
jgi:hypothetical protein